MGWDSCDAWRTQKDVAEDFDRGMVRNTRIRRLAGGIVRHEGQTAYVTAWEDTVIGGRFAIVCLIERQGGRLARKDMSEDMGPYFAGCPDAVWQAIKGQPLPATWGSGSCSAQWRERVLAARGEASLSA